MEQNSTFHDRYLLERLLGRGNFSEVWLAKDKMTDIQVALKIYAPSTGLDDTGLNMFAREFALVVNANHRNLLKPIYYDSCDRKPYLVLPYCQSGSIQGMVGKFTEEEAWKLLRDGASGLAYLHAMTPTVIHQDIKPDNIMIGNNGDYMITDFGVSTHLRSALRKSQSAAFKSAGTMAYMAPERFSKDNTPIMANDIYSLGATVFEMITGMPPFGDDGGLMQKKGAEVPEVQGEYSLQLKKTLVKCLNVDSWRRPTAEQLERYATTALEGKNIQFADEKTFWQKFRWPIIAACVLVVAGTVFGVKKAQDAAALRAAIAAEKARVASVEARILASESKADSLFAVGELHQEYYESAYIGAFQSYETAISACGEHPKCDSLLTAKGLEGKKAEVGQKLYDSYVSLIGRALIFEKNPDVAQEFSDRAAQVSAVIDITAFASSQEADDPSKD